MKKTSKFLALALAGTMLLTACGTGNTTTTSESATSETKEATESVSSEAAEKVTLTFWAEFITPERTEFVERMAANYMAEHSNVTIEVTPLPDSAADKVLTAYEAGQGPDIFLSSGPDIAAHINGDYIIPLDEYYENSSLNGKILDSALDIIREYDTTGNKDLYYIPNGISFTALWVRSDWLEETNSSVDTWEDLFQAVENMTNDERYGIAIRGGKGGAKFLDRMMFSYSGILSLFDEDGKCTINDPKNVEFVERYLGMYGKYTAEGDLNYGWTELAAAFDSGKAGIIIHNLGSASNHMEAFEGDMTKFEAVGMPLNDQGTSVNLLIQPGGMTISSTCKYPDEAWKFIEYMNTGDPESEMAQQWGVVPVNTDVLENAEWIQELPWYQAAAEQLLDENTIFYKDYSWMPGHDDCYGEIDTLSQYVMTGEMTAQEMCDQWAEYWQECYDKAYK